MNQIHIRWRDGRNGTATGFTTAEGYQKYEAGTPNIAGGIGLGVAVEYLEKIGMEKIRSYEEALTERLINGLFPINGIHVYAPEKPLPRIGVVSFTLDGFHPHEVAQLLMSLLISWCDQAFHCCQPLMEHLKLPDGTVRAQPCAIQTGHEIDMLLATLKELAGSPDEGT